jgi:cyclophilin family peptidyl-prolyl cis-trans isomerase
MLRLASIGILTLSAARAVAQSTPLTPDDTALIARVLLAEDRRDTLAEALGEAMTHRDARVRTLAQRARWRIRDPLFAARDSLPPLPAPVAWPEPAWRLRYRALTANRNDCGALRAAVADSAWPVRLRAADLVTATCAQDDSLVSTLRGWIDALPRNTSRRDPGAVSWHAAAHAAVALARMRPIEARPRTRTMSRHRQWEVRMYAARAASVLADTALLRALVRDRDGNVKEAAIDALSKLTGHADDALYVDALTGKEPQAVRAAAIALKGSTHPRARPAANAQFERWARRENASERDVRVALLEAAGRPVSDDRPPPTDVELPSRVVALALGEVVTLRVIMSGNSGGGSFAVRLRGDNAPIMAARILDLVRRGYYNKGNWHRVEHDFVIQGAGPGSNEFVGYKAYLRDELGTLPHRRGTVGMSTRSHDTGDAQWFINLKDNPRLIRDYTVFAEVVDGMDVVDGILEGDVVARIIEERRDRR